VQVRVNHDNHFRGNRRDDKTYTREFITSAVTKMAKFLEKIDHARAIKYRTSSYGAAAATPCWIRWIQQTVRCRSSRGTGCRRGNAPARCGTECTPPPGTRLRREWQKDLTAFRRPFKPPRWGSTPDRKRRSADRPAGRPAIGLTSLAVPSDLRVPARSSTHAPSSSRSCERSPGARSS